ncbi:MAG: biotin--[acetyl-CoA-carboxylase] ligase [Mycobacteriales bacterium]
MAIRVLRVESARSLAIVYADLDRPPLRAAALQGALVRDGSLWRELRVLAETESTNADVATAARAGADEGLVVVAERQSGGRGRLNRSWSSPPGAGLTLSVLLRPRTPAAGWGWLPLLTGVAVVAALREHAAVPAGLKWPNDVLVDGRKCAGILAEVVGDAVVLGVGLNVTTTVAELPDARATSLALCGATTLDRDTLLRALLRSLATAYAGWLADPAALGPAYRSVCVTLGREVRLELPDGSTVEGTAADVDTEGRLVVAGTAYAAGDVVHLR